MELQQEIIDKLTKCAERIRSLTINEDMIEELKYKLCPLTQDLDFFAYYITDLELDIRSYTALKPPISTPKKEGE